MTQAEFAATLGVKQNTISAYERGELHPSDSVLLLLAMRAENEEERGAVAESMEDPSGLPDSAAQSEFFINTRRALEELRAVQKLGTYRPSNREALAELALAIAQGDYVPNWLVDILGLWWHNRRQRDTWEYFQRAVSSVRMELAERENQEAEASQTLFRIMIRCPQTKKPVDTHYTTDRESWRNLDLEPQRLECPACGGTHHWRKEDAYLRRAS